MSRSLYLAIPVWTGAPEDIHESVVEDLLHGPIYMRVGLELLALAGRGDRVKEIETLLDVAHQREPPALNTEEVRRLEQLLDGLDDALRPLLDDRWQILPEHMEEIKRRTTDLHLEDAGGQIGSNGVAQGLSEVHELRAFLRQATDRGLNLLMG
jgi:hypothetical protein